MHTYTGWVVLLSFLFAFILAGLPVDVFYDRANYLVYADSSAQILDRYLSSGLLSVLANEPVWLAINIFLSDFFNAEMTLRVIIFYSSFFITYKVLRYKPKFFILVVLFLLLPQALKNNIVHLRQGVGLSFFLIGYFATNRAIKAAFLLMSPFVHASFFFILFFYYVNKIFHYLRLAADVRSLIIILFGIFISISGLYIAGVLGARQGVQQSYTSFGMHSIGLGFIFWSIILVLYFSAGKLFLKEQSLSITILLFYLSTYMFFPVAARIFESGLILVLLAGLNLKGKKFTLFVSLFFTYFIVQWSMRLHSPYFGWGLM